jgi:hypothetical protein
VNTSVEIDKIAGALVAVQAAMKPAIKDATNPHFRSKYADLGAIWEACREPLTKNGIFTGQDVTGDCATVAVTTRLIHTSGQWVEFGPLVIPLTKGDAQAVGSGVSYGKRYALAAALGIIAEDDDDGNTATASASKAPDYSQQVRKPAPNGNGHTAPSPGRETVNKQTGEITDSGLLTVREVARKEGNTNGRKWTKWTVHFADGSKATTLDRRMGEAAEAAVISKATVRPLLKEGKFGSELEALDVAQPAPNGKTDPSMYEEPAGFMDVPDDDIPF